MPMSSLCIILCLWDQYLLYLYKMSMKNQPICGLYYKRITIVIDAPSVVSKWRSKL